MTVRLHRQERRPKVGKVLAIEAGDGAIKTGSASILMKRQHDHDSRQGHHHQRLRKDRGRSQRRRGSQGQDSTELN
jgi:hypothetical protein